MDTPKSSQITTKRFPGGLQKLFWKDVSFIYVDSVGLTKLLQIAVKTALCPNPPAQGGAVVRTISPFRTNPLIATLKQRIDATAFAEARFPSFCGPYESTANSIQNVPWSVPNGAQETPKDTQETASNPKEPLTDSQVNPTRQQVASKRH